MVVYRSKDKAHAAALIIHCSTAFVSHGCENNNHNALPDREDGAVYLGCCDV